MPRMNLDWKLCLMLLGLYLAMAGILLNAFGLVPYLTLEIVLSIIGLISTVGVFAQYLVPFLQSRWAHRRKRIVILANIIGTIIIVGGLSWYGATIKTQWKSHLGPVTPLCEGSSGTQWYAPQERISYSCSSVGLALQQSNSSDVKLALREVQGREYSIVAYRVQVQVAFQKPDDSMTWASLLFPVALVTGATSVYELAVNSTGNWVVRQVGDVQNLAQGNIDVNLNQPVRITAVIGSGSVVGSVTDQWGNQLASASFEVLPMATTGSLLSLICLKVERRSSVSSSPVVFSYFELDD